MGEDQGEGKRELVGMARCAVRATEWRNKGVIVTGAFRMALDEATLLAQLCSADGAARHPYRG